MVAVAATVVDVMETAITPVEVESTPRLKESQLQERQTPRQHSRQRRLIFGSSHIAHTR